MSALTALTLRAQLAITEVMSSSSTTYRGKPIPPGPDYWELTNYGRNAQPLTGWRFNDNTGGLGSADSIPFEDLILQPGGSIVFVQNDTPAPGQPPMTAEAFRALWGLSIDVPVVLYTANRFGAAGDEVWLWDPEAALNSDFADLVKFATATAGRSFTYDLSTGLFGALSTVGVNGAFRAAQSDDVGSPGVAPPPLPITILRQPRSVVANPGDTVQFTIEASGLPRAKCRWFRNDQPLPIGSGYTLTLSQVEFADEGRYRAELDNGSMLVLSEIALLNLRRQSSPPRWLETLHDRELFIGQTVTFEVVATGLPQPTFTWWQDGQLIVGARGRSLTLAKVSETDAGRYTVVASNLLGAVTNAATLTVTRRPRLVITEVMPAANLSDRAPREDWWELTNFDDHPVDLFGYRFDDGGEFTLPSLGSSWTVPTHVVLRPGESVIFVENLSAEEFRRWWGPENLPVDLQIVTYRGAALSLSSDRGDTIWLWNSGATSDVDYLAGVEFTAAEVGRSFILNPTNGQFPGNSTGRSHDGEYGAFIAAEGGDVGSPGYIDTPPLKILKVATTLNGTQVTWRTRLGDRYTLQSADHLESSDWENLESHVATGGTLSQIDPRPPRDGERFYRIAVVPGNP